MPKISKLKWKKPKRKKRPIVMLVDGDIIAYQAVTEAMVEHQNEHDEWTYTVNMDAVKEMLDTRMSEHERELRADETVMCFGGKGKNWRARIMPEYKANRTGKKPLGYWACVEWMMEEWNGKRTRSLEADDLVGMAATDPEFMPGYDKIMVSEDKDFNCIPGKLYNPRYPERGVVEISERQADEFHLMQALAGDGTDNYKGCPGIGMLTAERLVRGDLAGKSVSFIWTRIVAEFKKKGLTEADALMNARVARILRASDFKNGKVVPWTPPKSEVKTRRRSRAEAKKKSIKQ